jgi:hypothetical protein
MGSGRPIARAASRRLAPPRIGWFSPTKALPQEARRERLADLLADASPALVLSEDGEKVASINLHAEQD